MSLWKYRTPLLSVSYGTLYTPSDLTVPTPLAKITSNRKPQDSQKIPESDSNIGQVRVTTRIEWSTTTRCESQLPTATASRQPTEETQRSCHPRKRNMVKTTHPRVATPFLKVCLETTLGTVNLPSPTKRNVVPFRHASTPSLPYVTSAHKHAGET